MCGLKKSTSQLISMLSLREPDPRRPLGIASGAEWTNRIEIHTSTPTVNVWTHTWDCWHLNCFSLIYTNVYILGCRWTLGYQWKWKWKCTSTLSNESEPFKFTLFSQKIMNNPQSNPLIIYQKIVNCLRFSKRALHLLTQHFVHTLFFSCFEGVNDQNQKFRFAHLIFNIKGLICPLLPFRDFQKLGPTYFQHTHTDMLKHTN